MDVEPTELPQRDPRGLRSLLLHPCGHHDIYLYCKSNKDRLAVPYLIHALQWEKYNPPGDDTMICGKAHCLDALESLTRENPGINHEDWLAWWETAKHLSDWKEADVIYTGELQRMGEILKTQFVSDDLVRQIMFGEKTASVVACHEVNAKEDEYNDPLIVGRYYDVYDSSLEPLVRIRITAMELCRWDSIPARLWIGETNADADEFREDHREYFNDPGDNFEFVAYYFERV